MQTATQFTHTSSGFLRTDKDAPLPRTVQRLSASYGSKQYELKDHLGNVRATLSDRLTVLPSGLRAPELLSATDFFPFGMEMPGRSYNSNGYRFGFNGKEKENTVGQGDYDFGARIYDSKIGRWLSLDPLASKYPSLSPYNFVANNPIISIDPDGKKIIFVNGYKGFGSPSGGAKYWNGAGSSFVKGAKSYFGDNQKPLFTDIDHSLLSTADERHDEGYQWAKDNISLITDGMTKDNDVFRLVTHSMGAAFGEGVSELLKEEGWSVAQVVNINAFQAGDIKTKPEHPEESEFSTISSFCVDYQNTDDPVINNPVRSSPGTIDNSTSVIREDSGVTDIRNIHRSPIDSKKDGGFWNRLSGLISKSQEKK